MDDTPPEVAELDVEPVSEGVSPQIGELVEILDDLLLAAREARTVPLSGNVMLDREELLAQLERIKELLPEELRAARWMVRERESFVARTNEQAKAIQLRAQEEARRLVSESNIVSEAVEEANALVRRAEGEARRIRLEAEDLAEDRLEHLEVLFGNLLRQIRDARAEFHRARPPEPEVPISE